METPTPKILHFFDKIICFIKIICIFALSKDDNNRTTLNLYTMKTPTYILRPVTDINDMVLYYEFVRKEDDAILRASADYDFLLAYAEGYTTARNSSFIVE